MSEFETFDHAKKRLSQPFQTADGVEITDEDEIVVSEIPEDCHEIRIVTGVHGRVAGSKVFIDGKPVSSLIRFEAVGIMGGRWEVSINQAIGGSDSV